LPQRRRRQRHRDETDTRANIPSLPIKIPPEQRPDPHRGEIRDSGPFRKPLRPGGTDDDLPVPLRPLGQYAVLRRRPPSSGLLRFGSGAGPSATHTQTLKSSKNAPRKGHCGRIGVTLRCGIPPVLRYKIELCPYIQPMRMRGLEGPCKCFGIYALSECHSCSYTVARTAAHPPPGLPAGLRAERAAGGEARPATCPSP